MEAAYWQQRLFKNTFTYKGQTRAVNSWSVKMQLFGKRKTFSLSSSDRAKAAAEACQIFQALNTQGWEAVSQRRAKVGFQPELPTAPPAPEEFSEHHWKRRLIHRRHPEKHPAAEPELSARIEYSGISRYFPLRTNDEARAAALAMKIHHSITSQGWAVANQNFVRELTLAFRWLEDPLAWTYTTIHTVVNGKSENVAGLKDVPPNARAIMLVEPDTSIRLALRTAVNNVAGFNCVAAYAHHAEALREILRRKVDLVLMNYELPDQPGSNCLAEMQKAKPGTVGLLYSVFEDSDQLFKSTPGGAAGYMLKRTPNHRLFEPIADAAGPVTREMIAVKIREYFQRLVSAMSTGPTALDVAKLTPREHEILALLAKGDLAKEIADKLGISIWTVHGHVKSIFEKLHVHTRTEAVVKFLQK